MHFSFSSSLLFQKNEQPLDPSPNVQSVNSSLAADAIKLEPTYRRWTFFFLNPLQNEFVLG